MTQNEETLIFALSTTYDDNKFVVMLQTFIQEYGPLSEDAKKDVRGLINERGLKIDL